MWFYQDLSNASDKAGHEKLKPITDLPKISVGPQKGQETTGRHDKTSTEKMLSSQNCILNIHFSMKFQAVLLNI